MALQGGQKRVREGVVQVDGVAAARNSQNRPTRAESRQMAPFYVEAGQLTELILWREERR